MALGGVIGGILGSAVGGPLGASIGTGLGQLVEGGFQKKKAKAMQPAPVSPIDQATFNMLRRRQQKIATGTEYNPQAVAGQQMAKSLKNASFAAGGAPNMGIYSNLMSQTLRNITEASARDTAQASAQVAEQGARISDISRDLKLLQQNKMEADAAKNEEAGFQNLAAGLMPKGNYVSSTIQDVFNPKKKKKTGEVDLTEEETEGES